MRKREFWFDVSIGRLQQSLMQAGIDSLEADRDEVLRFHLNPNDGELTVERLAEAPPNRRIPMRKPPRDRSRPVQEVKIKTTGGYL